MIRETSLEAYKALVEGGILRAMHSRVYTCLFRGPGPQTRNEVARIVDMVRNDVSSRLRELRDMGLVREHEKRKCLVTGRTVLTYDVTDRKRPIVVEKHRRGVVQITTQICAKPEGSASCPFFCPDEDTGEPGCWAAAFLDEEVVFTDDFDFGMRPEDCPMKRKTFVISDN